MSRLRFALESWARALRRDALTLWLAARDPRTPTRAKILAGAVAAYAFSPVDLIPDFIPVLGLLDDLLILPLGVWMARKMIPAALLAEFRATATALASRPVVWPGAVVIVTIWCGCAAGLAWLIWS